MKLLLTLALTTSALAPSALVAPGAPSFRATPGAAAGLPDSPEVKDKDKPGDQPSGLTKPTQGTGDSLFQPGPNAPEVLGLERGLNWLATEQAKTGDGSFPRGEGKDIKYAPVAVTALGALALMAGGSTASQGPHHVQVGRAIDYLLVHTDLSPASPHHGFISAGGDETSLMHGHGFATLALAEAYGMSPKGEHIATALKAAIALIERTQGTAGAWFYKPERQSEHEGSLTVCMVQALRAAEEAGVHVDAEVIAKADGYLERSQVKDGSFAYQIGSPRTSVALTAAAISALNATGTYSGDSLNRATDAIWRDLAKRKQEGQLSRFPYYERFYLAQAFWQSADESHYKRWFPDERTQILRTQNKDGSWADTPFGQAYATSMNCLVLAIPGSLLPAFQR
ncbi:MAG: terpene cyclase/mutase family protein [Planctomycetota bacterium]|nr:terpene cyclase/mutase family protein [Planctomycetota bacterium]